MTDEPAAHPALSAHYAAVDAYWDAIGTSDSAFLSFIKNPEDLGYPPWPNRRQAYRFVYTADTVIIASDGLSDPAFDPRTGEAGPGYGCEVYLETPDLAGADFLTIQKSWLREAIQAFGTTVARRRGITDTLDEYGVMSIELPVSYGAPPELLTPQGHVGALIGLDVPGRASGIEVGATGPVRFVPLTVVTPAEIARIVEGGAAARAEVAAGRSHLSTATSPPT